MHVIEPVNYMESETDGHSACKMISLTIYFHRRV